MEKKDTQGVKSPAKDQEAVDQEVACPPKRPDGLSRRDLCVGAAGAVAMIGLGSLSLLESKPVRRPPGGQDEDRVVSACIRCMKCYEACPNNVIVPSHIEDGILGMRSPVLDFSRSYCDFCDELNGGHPACVAACPTKALRLNGDEKATDVIIGLAVINERECLAFRDTGCRDCYDACPYEAIKLDREGRNPRPEVIADKCNGCGACESVCLSMKSGSIASGATERAIVIRPLAAIN